MSHAADWTTGGIWPLQDHDPDAAVEGRSYMAGRRVTGRGNDLTEPFEQDHGTLGDIQGGLLVRARPGERGDLHSWWLTGLPVVNTGPLFAGSESESRERRLDAGGDTADFMAGDYLPIHRIGESELTGGLYEPDLRYEGLALRQEHPFIQNQLWPAGWTGLVSAASDETEQVEVFHADFMGLVAPYSVDGADGDSTTTDADLNVARSTARYGTPVFDVRAGKLTDWARLQSFFRVLPLEPGDECAPGATLGLSEFGGVLAWNIGSSEPDRTSLGGVVTDDAKGDAGGRGEQGAAVLSSQRGGLVDAVAEGCQHLLRQGGTADLTGVRPAHLPTHVLYHNDGLWDCPAEHQDVPYEPTRTAPFLTPVHWRVDFSQSHTIPCGGGVGLGRWQAEMAMYYKPPDDGGKEKEKERGKGGTVPRGGSGTGGPDGSGGGEGSPDGDIFGPFPLPGDEIVFGPGRVARPDGNLFGPGPTDGTTETGGGVSGPAIGANELEFERPNFGRVLFSLASDQPTYTGILNPGETRGFSASLATVAAPSFALRPQLRQVGAFDARRATGVPADVLDTYDATTPVVGHFVSFAKESGGAYAYGNLPGASGAIYPGGDADGVTLFMPPDREEASVCVGTTALATTFGVHKSVIFAWGCPLTDGSAAADGWISFVDEASADELTITPLDATGAPETGRQLTIESSLHLQERDATDFFSVNVQDGTGPFVAMTDASTAAVSSAGTGRLRYNNSSTSFQTSVNGGAWTNIGAGGGGPSPYGKLGMSGEFF